MRSLGPVCAPPADVGNHEARRPARAAAPAARAWSAARPARRLRRIWRWLRSTSPASRSKLMGSAPIGVMTCACPTNRTGRVASAAPPAVTGVNQPDGADPAIGESLLAINLSRNPWLPDGHRWRNSCAITFAVARLPRSNPTSFRSVLARPRHAAPRCARAGRALLR